MTGISEVRPNHNKFHFDSWGSRQSTYSLLNVKGGHQDLTGISEVRPNHNKLHFESSGLGKALTGLKVKEAKHLPS